MLPKIEDDVKMVVVVGMAIRRVVDHHPHGRNLPRTVRRNIVIGIEIIIVPPPLPPNDGNGIIERNHPHHPSILPHAMTIVEVVVVVVVVTTSVGNHHPRGIIIDLEVDLSVLPDPDPKTKREKRDNPPRPP